MIWTENHLYIALKKTSVISCIPYVVKDNMDQKTVQEAQK